MGFNLQENNSKRLRLDRIGRWTVSIGGVSILAMLLLIFVFLTMELIPIFNQNNRLAEGTDSLVLPENAQAIYASQVSDTVYAVDDKNDWFQLSTATPVAKREIYIHPGFTPINRGRELWRMETSGRNQVDVYSLDDTVATSHSIELPVDLNEVQSLSYVAKSQSLTLVGTTDSELFTAYLSSKGKRQVTVLNRQRLAIEGVALSSAGDGLLLWGKDNILISRLNGADIHTLATIEGIDEDIVEAHLIPGSFGFVAQTASGELQYWSMLSLQQGFQIQKLAHLDMGDPQAEWDLMHRHRTVLIFEPSKGVTAWQLTNNTTSELLSFDTAVSAAVNFTYLPNIDKAVWWSGDQLHRLPMRGYRPELSLKNVFGKVWFDGYEEPEFVWQTTALADNYEAKVSLVPLVFGTIKAAFYAMLFAVPIAIGGAIYTAYFMSSALRAWVKPTIELMEALPTVIIGFLAGLWLAPMIDENLVSSVLFLFLFPLLIVLVSFIWSWVPKKVTSNIPSGLHLITVVPMIIFSLLLAQWAAPIIENGYFFGDVQTYLADRGIAYDQRNSFIVGIAMGFAVIPTIFTLAEEAIFSVPKHLSQAAFALGASKWQALSSVVLQTASSGIVSAIMVGLGKAVGETMIVLMATGNTPVQEWNIFEGMRSLASTIAIEMPESEVASSHYQILILSAFLLFVFTFLLNSLAEMIRQRLREKYRSL
nr:ABC transporter permease subunit [Vibrio ulleungensis]